MSLRRGANRIGLALAAPLSRYPTGPRPIETPSGSNSRSQRAVRISI